MNQTTIPLASHRAGHGRLRGTRVPLLLLALAGCAAGPDFQTPVPPPADRYAASPPAATVGAPGAGPQRLLSGADIPAQWWMLFQSPLLDAWVREALAHSPTLAQARAPVASPGRSGGRDRYTPIACRRRQSVSSPPEGRPLGLRRPCHHAACTVHAVQRIDRRVIHAGHIRRRATRPGRATGAN